MNNEDVLKRLQQASGCFELAHVTTYKGYRSDGTGQTSRVTIEVHDHGTAAGDLRYLVVATDERGRVAAGNPDASLDLAIGMVHWDELRKPGNRRG
jgi:hypothetical protein